MCVEAIQIEWVRSIQGVCGRRPHLELQGRHRPFSFSLDAHGACPASDECQADRAGTLEGWQPSETNSFAGFPLMPKPAVFPWSAWPAQDM